MTPAAMRREASRKLDRAAEALRRADDLKEEARRLEDEAKWLEARADTEEARRADLGLPPPRPAGHALGAPSPDFGQGPRAD